MRFPGFPSKDRQARLADEAYLSRRPGESAAAFEARMAAAASERQAAPGVFARRPVIPPATKRPPEPRPRRRRHGLGLIGAVVTLAAVLGALWVALAVHEGSFSAGGAVVDRKIAEAALPAKVAASQAVDRTGQAVQNAGQAIESQGEKIRKTAN